MIDKDSKVSHFLKPGCVNIVCACADRRLVRRYANACDKIFGEENYFFLTGIGAILRFRKNSNEFDSSIEVISDILQICRKQKLHGGLNLCLIPHEDCKGYEGLCDCESALDWAEFMRKECEIILVLLKEHSLFLNMPVTFTSLFLELDGTCSNTQGNVLYTPPLTVSQGTQAVA